TVVFVVEEGHGFRDVGFAVDGVGAVGNLDGIIGIVGHVALGAALGGGLHEVGFELAQGVGGGGFRVVGRGRFGGGRRGLGFYCGHAHGEQKDKGDKTCLHSILPSAVEILSYCSVQFVV